MVDYASLASTAKRLIDENGRSVTLRLKDRTPANAAAPWDGPGTADVDISVKAVIFPFKAADIDGELIRREDKQAFVAATDAGLVAASSNAVENFDLLIDATEDFKIMNVEVIEPGDTRVLYVVQLRK